MYTQEESWRRSQALGTCRSPTSIDNTKDAQHFGPRRLLLPPPPPPSLPLFPATVISTRLVMEPVCCDTPLISPGAHHSIFNSYCYAATNCG